MDQRRLPDLEVSMFVIGGWIDIQLVIVKDSNIQVTIKLFILIAHGFWRRHFLDLLKKSYLTKIPLYTFDLREEVG